MRSSHESARVAILGIVLCGAALSAVLWLGSDSRVTGTPHATGAETREALAETFASDIRNLVYEWDPADPRPVAERQRLLFDFIYQTYQSTAWIPQSLFDGNAMTQVVAGDVTTIVRDRIGLVTWPENTRVPAFGMAPSQDAARPLSWTVNCVICHTAEIDGVAYFGAGGKTFDEKRLSDSLKLLTGYGRHTLSRAAPALDGQAAAGLDTKPGAGAGSGIAAGPSGVAEIPRDQAARAYDILTRHHHDKIDALTRGRSTAFAASHVELYMRPNGNRMPSVEEVGRGDVKIPPLWHVAAKRPVGRWYTDGSFHGPYPLMASSMELEKDRSFDALATLVVPAIKQEFESVLQYLRPPKYPYAIDRALAEEGRALFYSREVGCSRCHGTYDGDGDSRSDARHNGANDGTNDGTNDVREAPGTVRWPGRHEDVGTDPARLRVVRPQFIEAFNASPLAADGRLEESEGYAATPLTGVWANFPYLHNGSVPTLWHLLGPASERPRTFEVMAARRFDRERVGQPLYTNPRDADRPESALLLRFRNNRDWFVVTRPGCGNEGHDFWTRIKTDARRRALIEYLKTL